MPWSLWLSPSSRRMKSLWYRFLWIGECKCMKGGGGVVSSFMPPCVQQAVSEDKWTLPRAWDGGQSARSTDLVSFATAKYGFVVERRKKTCTWWPWKPAFTRATAHGAVQPSTGSQSQPGMWCVPLKRPGAFCQLYNNARVCSRRRNTTCCRVCPNIFNSVVCFFADVACLYNV